MAKFIYLWFEKIGLWISEWNNFVNLWFWYKNRIFTK